MPEDKRFFRPEAIAQIQKWTPISLLSTSIVVSVALISTTGYQVYQNQQVLQKNPSEENQRRFNASLEVLKTTVSGIGTLATIAGGVVLYLNFRVATRNAQIAADNLKVSEEKQVTERFAKAIEHLGNSDVHIRLGGIYALERIARDSKKEHWTIMEILSAYVRERSPVKPTKFPAADSEKPLVESCLAEGSSNEKADDVLDKVTVDIQAALTVIGRRKVEQDPDGARIDLSASHLYAANLNNANLNNADLESTNLRCADLSSASLYAANLFGTDLSYAELIDADLTEATFTNDLIREVDPILARFMSADLTEAALWDANLTSTDLVDVHGLTDKQLGEAKLCRTSLPYGSKLDPNRDCEKIGFPAPSDDPITLETPDVITPEGKEEGEEGKD